MRQRPSNTLNRSEHDFLIALAEDVPPIHAAASVGWSEVTLRSAIYRLMGYLSMSPCGWHDENVAALIREAKFRGYENAPYSHEYDDERGPRFQPIR